MRNLWIVTLLHSVSDVVLGNDTMPYLIKNNAVDKLSLNEARNQTAIYRVQTGAKYSTDRILLKTEGSTEMSLPDQNVIQTK